MVIWRILVSISSLGSVLKGQFLPGSTKQRQEDQADSWGILWECAFIILSVPGAPIEKKSSWRGDVLLWKPATYENHLILFHLKKYHWGSFSVGLPVSTKNPSSMVDTVLVLQNLWQPLHTNLSARKRHRKDKKVFFCLQSPQWGRQKSTVWIIHVLV